MMRTAPFNHSAAFYTIAGAPQKSGPWLIDLSSSLGGQGLRRLKFPQFHLRIGRSASSGPGALANSSDCRETVWLPYAKRPVNNAIVIARMQAF
jgi:hypothetical protein